jgi:hypothetical protein
VYTFCFAVAHSSEAALALCSGALSNVEGSLPRLGSPPRIESLVLPEVNAAFASLKPERDRTPSWIQATVSSELAVFVFGESGDGAGLAEGVAGAFARGGIDSVVRSSGSFSAVIVEIPARRVWVAGTLLGHRSLFYFARPGLLLVSPHDLTLLGTGQVPFGIDSTSLASMLACDWSLSGHSLLAGIVRCHPLEVLRWQGGQLKIQPSATLSLEGRIDPRDRRGLTQQMGRIVESLLDEVRVHVRDLETVACSLTAGMDSRALLALLCGATSPANISTSTLGEEKNLDVVVARQLARLVGARHERRQPTPPTTEDFAGLSRLFAFFCSGDTNAKRALGRLPELEPRSHPFAGGNGGEIFRGFFYPYFGATGTAPKSMQALLARLVSYRFRRLGRLPFSDPASSAAVKERLQQALGRYERCSSNPYDVVDLLYLFERYGRWGAYQACLPWRRSWTPFESVEAIRDGFRLPAPIGKFSDVHALLVRRFLPARAYWMPINGGQLLPLEGNGRLRYALRQALNVSSLVRQRVTKRLRKGARRSDEVKADFLSGPLAEQTASLLGDEGSLSRTLFGRDGVAALLDGKRHAEDRLAVVGIAVTAETWQVLARAIARRAGR